MPLKQHTAWLCVSIFVLFLLDWSSDGVLPPRLYVYFFYVIHMRLEYRASGIASIVHGDHSLSASFPGPPALFRHLITCLASFSRVSRPTVSLHFPILLLRSHLLLLPLFSTFTHFALQLFFFVLLRSLLYLFPLSFSCTEQFLSTLPPFYLYFS